MGNIFKWLLGFKTSGSREMATSRMKLMVIHDRYQMPPAIIEQMRQELIAVASRYFEVDPESTECVIKSQGNRRAFISAIVPLLKKGSPEDAAQHKSAKKSKTRTIKRQEISSVV
jgi:cell division topological specificity factor MinE